MARVSLWPIPPEAVLLTSAITELHREVPLSPACGVRVRDDDWWVKERAEQAKPLEILTAETAEKTHTVDFIFFRSSPFSLRPLRGNSACSAVKGFLKAASHARNLLTTFPEEPW